MRTYHKFIDILSESREFEDFLNKHDDVWDQYEKAQQVSRVPGMQGEVGPVVRPHITRDDLGGRQALQALRKSTRPEAELDRMIQQAYKANDYEKGSKLEDFRKEFLLQRAEIQQGIRRQYDNIQTTYDNANSPAEPNVLDPNTGRLMRDDPQEYMVPLATAQAQAAAMGGGEEPNVTLRKNQDDSISAQVSGNASQIGGGQVASRMGSDSNKNIRHRFRDRLSTLRRSGGNPQLSRRMEELDKLFYQVDAMKGEERKRARADWDTKALAVMNSIGSRVPATGAAQRDSEQPIGGAMPSQQAMGQAGNLPMSPMQAWANGEDEPQPQMAADQQVAQQQVAQQQMAPDQQVPQQQMGEPQPAPPVAATGTKSRKTKATKEPKATTTKDRSSQRTSGGGRATGRQSNTKPSRASRRVDVDRRKRVNPFGKRATKDPNVETQLEMASKRVSGIKKQMKDLIDQIKKEKNPVIKKRLIAKLAGLDRQLGTAYITLERIKGLSALTTELGTHNFEQLRDMFRETEALSVAASAFHGKKPQVWKTADVFSRSTGQPSTLESMFKDSKDEQTRRFGNRKSDAESKKLNGREDLDPNEDEQDLLNQTFDEFDNDFDTPEDQEEVPSPTVSMMDKLHYLSDEESAARDAEIEKAKKDQEKWDAMYVDPYEDETPKERKNRLKMEKKVKKEIEEIDSLMMPVYDAIKEIPETGERSNEKALLQLQATAIHDGMMQRVNQKINGYQGRGLFRKPLQRDFYTDDHIVALTKNVDRMQRGGGNSESVSSEFNRVLTRVGGKNLDEGEKVIALAIVEANAWEQTDDGRPQLTKWGKDFLEALKNYDGKYVYERDESRKLFKNVLYLTKHIARDFAPTRRDGEGGTLNGIRVQEEGKLLSQVYMLRDLQAQRSGFDGNPGESIPVPFEMKDDSGREVTISPKIGGKDKPGVSMYKEMGKKAPKTTVSDFMKRVELEQQRASGLKPLGFSGIDGSAESREDQTKAELIKQIEAGEISKDDPFVKAILGDLPESYFGIGLVPLLLESVLTSKVAYILENSLWSKYVDSVGGQASLLEESNSYLSGSKAGVKVYDLVQNDYDFLLSEEGYHWANGIQETLGEMPAEVRMRYKLAEKEFLRVNRYHTIREHVGFCMEAALYEGEMPQFQMNPFTREVLREERQTNSTDFYQSLIEVSKESLMDTTPTFELFEDVCATCGGGGGDLGGGGYTSGADAAGPEAGYDLPITIEKPKKRKQAKPSSRKRFSLKDIKEKYSR